MQDMWNVPTDEQSLFCWHLRGGSKLPHHSSLQSAGVLTDGRKPNETVLLVTATPAEPTRCMFVKTLSGKDMVYSVNPDDLVQTLKCQIEVRGTLPRCCLTLSASTKWHGSSLVCNVIFCQRWSRSCFNKRGDAYCLTGTLAGMQATEGFPVEQQILYFAARRLEDDWKFSDYNVPLDQQILYFAGCRLDDDWKFSDYNIKNGPTSPCHVALMLQSQG